MDRQEVVPSKVQNNYEDVICKHRDVLKELLEKHRVSIHTCQGIGDHRTLVQTCPNTFAVNNERILWRRTSSVRKIIGHSSDWEFQLQFSEVQGLESADSSLKGTSNDSENEEVFFDCFEPKSLQLAFGIEHCYESDQPTAMAALHTLTISQGNIRDVEDLNSSSFRQNFIDPTHLRELGSTTSYLNGSSRSSRVRSSDDDIDPCEPFDDCQQSSDESKFAAATTTPSEPYYDGSIIDDLRNSAPRHTMDPTVICETRITVGRREGFSVSPSFEPKSNPRDQPVGHQQSFDENHVSLGTTSSELGDDDLRIDEHSQAISGHNLDENFVREFGSICDSRDSESIAIDTKHDNDSSDTFNGCQDNDDNNLHASLQAQPYGEYSRFDDVGQTDLQSSIDATIPMESGPSEPCQGHDYSLSNDECDSSLSELNCHQVSGSLKNTPAQNSFDICQSHLQNLTDRTTERESDSTGSDREGRSSSLADSEHGSNSCDNLCISQQFSAEYCHFSLKHQVGNPQCDDSATDDGNRSLPHDSIDPIFFGGYQASVSRCLDSYSCDTLDDRQQSSDINRKIGASPTLTEHGCDDSRIDDSSDSVSPKSIDQTDRTTSGLTSSRRHSASISSGSESNSEPCRPVDDVQQKMTANGKVSLNILSSILRSNDSRIHECIQPLSKQINEPVSTEVLKLIENYPNGHPLSELPERSSDLCDQWDSYPTTHEEKSSLTVEAPEYFGMSMSKFINQPSSQNYIYATHSGKPNLVSDHRDGDFVSAGYYDGKEPFDNLEEKSFANRKIISEPQGDDWRYDDSEQFDPQQAMDPTIVNESGFCGSCQKDDDVCLNIPALSSEGGGGHSSTADGEYCVHSSYDFTTLQCLNGQNGVESAILSSESNLFTVPTIDFKSSTTKPCFQDENPGLSSSTAVNNIIDQSAEITTMVSSPMAGESGGVTRVESISELDDTLLVSLPCSHSKGQIYIDPSPEKKNRNIVQKIQREVSTKLLHDESADVHHDHGSQDHATVDDACVDVVAAPRSAVSAINLSGNCNEKGNLGPIDWQEEKWMKGSEGSEGTAMPSEQRENQLMKLLGSDSQSDKSTESLSRRKSQYSEATPSLNREMSSFDPSKHTESDSGPVSPPEPIRQKIFSSSSDFNCRLHVLSDPSHESELMEQSIGDHQSRFGLSPLTISSDIANIPPRQRSQTQHFRVPPVLTSPKSVSRIRSRSTTSVSSPHLVPSPKCVHSTQKRADFNEPFLRTSERARLRRQHVHDGPSTPHRIPSTMTRSPISVSRSDCGPIMPSLLSTPPSQSYKTQVQSSPRVKLYHSMGKRNTPNFIQIPSKSICWDETKFRFTHGPTRTCTKKYNVNAHSTIGACDRCWSLASVAEQQKFALRGNSLFIARTRGGCDGKCLMFPQQHDRVVRLCRQCFHATHKDPGSR